MKYSDADRAEIQRQLTEQYISDYTATWRAGMDNLNIRNFESIGQLTGVQDGNFTVRFSVDGGAMTYRVHTDTEDNPFSGGLFSQFGLSDTLY